MTENIDVNIDKTVQIISSVFAGAAIFAILPAAVLQSAGLRCIHKYTNRLTHKPKSAAVFT
jgi:hypothetical protein